MLATATQMQNLHSQLEGNEAEIIDLLISSAKKELIASLKSTLPTSLHGEFEKLMTDAFSKTPSELIMTELSRTQELLESMNQEYNPSLSSTECAVRYLSEELFKLQQLAKTEANPTILALKINEHIIRASSESLQLMQKLSGGKFNADATIRFNESLREIFALFQSIDRTPVTTNAKISIGKLLLQMLPALSSNTAILQKCKTRISAHSKEFNSKLNWSLKPSDEQLEEMIALQLAISRLATRGIYLQIAGGWLSNGMAGEFYESFFDAIKDDQQRYEILDIIHEIFSLMGDDIPKVIGLLLGKYYEENPETKETTLLKNLQEKYSIPEYKDDCNHDSESDEESENDWTKSDVEQLSKNFGKMFGCLMKEETPQQHNQVEYK